MREREVVAVTMRCSVILLLGYMPCAIPYLL